MGSQHITRTVTPVLHRRSVVDATPVEMLEAQHENVRGVHYERSYECHKCRKVWPRSKILFVKGIPYCTPRRHYEDALHDQQMEERHDQDLGFAPEMKEEY